MKNILLNILTILVSLMLINSGLNKLFKYIPVPEGLPEELVKDNAAFMEIGWLMPLVAVAEIVGGILLIWPKTRALGVLIVFPVLVGVLLIHIFVAPSGLPMAIAFWVVLIWNIYENRKKYLNLIGK